MTEVRGANYPPLTRDDLANLATSISRQIRLNPVSEIDDQSRKAIADIPRRIVQFQNSSLRTLFTTATHQSVTSYLSLIQWIKAVTEPVLSWKVLEDNQALPSSLAERLQTLQKELKDVIINKEDFEQKISLINEATKAADRFPTNVKEVHEAKGKIEQLCLQAAELIGKIDSFHQQAIQTTGNIEEQKKETDKLVAQCEEAYRITTTKGLAAAFDQRAKRLADTMWLWVGGLILALVAGGFIGASRFETLTKALQITTPNWGLIWMDFSLSILGLAAPLWFAWLATKQISQRFRLAEDYAFKASVAKAYEGYKKEAARIDESFEARLFSSALTRLEEAPLRLVGNDHHSSPWQEFFSSTNFQKAMETMPELKDEFIKVAKDGVGRFRTKNKNKESVAVEPSDN